MHLLIRPVIATALVLAAPAGALPAEALLPPNPPSLVATPPPTANVQEPQAPTEFHGSSATVRHAAGDGAEVRPSRQRHHRRSTPAPPASRGAPRSDHVDRATADRITQQLNSREVERMRAAEQGTRSGRVGVSPGPDPSADALNREQLEPPGRMPAPADMPPRGVSRSSLPEPDRGPYPPR